MKIHPVRVKPFHADGQPDMTKVIINFHQFVNAPKNKNMPAVTQSPHKILIFATTYVICCM